MKLRHVDLCSGIGGFALGFEWAGLSSPVMFCDIEPWSRKILTQHWPDVPIAEDVMELANDPERLVPDCDILTAGYPCQPFSVAGKQKGTTDDRHIWPYICKIVAQKRPTWCVFENVYGHVALGLDQVLTDLEAEGYASRTFIVPACGVNAPHRRDRLWIVAHTTRNRGGRNTREFSKAYEQQEKERPQKWIRELNPTGEIQRSKTVGNATHNGRHWGGAQVRRAGAQDFTEQPQSVVWGKSGRPSQDVADTKSEQRNERQYAVSREQIEKEGVRSQAGTSGEAQADCSSRKKCNSFASMGGMADGLPARMDRFDGWDKEPTDIPRLLTGDKQKRSRLKGLGNAIVPQIAMRIGLTIKALIDE
jgi:DNA (cytosine-5)-methyltransferase 1